jgi:lipopolysaccharide/colanic/teichoic acid biosynthesis glycosyltransferase
MAKRIFDLVIALAGLVVACPMLLALALAIRLDSHGPIVFVQERVGRGGRLFRMHKFRTMEVDSGSIGPQITATNDKRITRVGACLRRYKLDELPQLFDVLIGNMSLVGPRPEVPRYVAIWPVDACREILSVRPGITDPMALEYFDEGALLAQSGDPEYTYVHDILPRKVRGYVEYVRNRTLAVDINVILCTIRRAVRG